MQMSVAQEDRRVVLAPFGMTARLWRDPAEVLKLLEENPELAEKNDIVNTSEWRPSSESPKSMIISLLKRRGVHISENCSWVRLHFPLARSISPSDVDQAPVYDMEWPAQLCFKNEELDKIDEHGSAWLEPGLLGIDTDPLREAETWFRDRHDRKQQIERRRLELKTLSEKEAQALLLKEEDIRPSLFPGIERQIEAQGLSGIYPTPPDGFRSQLPGHSTELEGSDQANRQEDSELLDQGDNSSKTTNHGGTPLNPLHGVGMSLGAYDGIEDDDLFGNMDSAMFTANGITEDDFSFFDEPKAPPTTASGSMAVPTDTQSLYTADRLPDNGFTSLPKEEEDDTMLVDNDSDQSEEDFHHDGQDHDVQQRMDPLVDQEMLHINSSRQVSLRLPDASSPAYGRDHRDEDMLDSAPPTLDRSSQEDIFNHKHSAFSTLSLQHLSKVVDQKYAGQGRFFVPPAEKEDPFPAESYKIQKSVPTLGFDVGQGDDFDSDTGW